MTNRTLRVRGGLRLKRTLGLRGDSNHSAQRLAEPRRSALAFCPFSILIFFAGGDLNWNGVAKRRGGLTLLHYTIILVYNVIGSGMMCI